MDGYVCEWINGYNFLKKKILDELIQIKYESKTLKLLDHIGEYLHVLRDQVLLNKSQKSLKKNVLQHI